MSDFYGMVVVAGAPANGTIALEPLTASNAIEAEPGEVTPETPVVASSSLEPSPVVAIHVSTEIMPTNERCNSLQGNELIEPVYTAQEQERTEQP